MLADQSPDDEGELAGLDELADDRMIRQLAGNEQAPGGLRIGQEHQLVRVYMRVEVRAHPVEVAP